MKDIFLSYSSQDRELATTVCQMIEKCGLTYYRFEADLAVGEAITNEIRQNIPKLSALLALITPISVNSKWVHYEIGFAEALAKRIIPVVVGVDEMLPHYLGEKLVYTSLEQLDAFLRSEKWAEYTVYRKGLFSFRSRNAAQFCLEAGIGDVYLRGMGGNALQFAPAAIFETAESDIMLLGLTAFRSATDFVDLFSRKVQEGIVVRIMTAHPKSQHLIDKQRLHRHNLKSEVCQTFEIIDAKNRQHELKIQIRWLRQPPSYTCILIDGDSNSGFIQLQLETKHQATQTGGMIQIHKTPEDGIYDYYRRDLQLIWERDAKVPDPGSWRQWLPG